MYFPKELPTCCMYLHVVCGRTAVSQTSCVESAQPCKGNHARCARQFMQEELFSGRPFAAEPTLATAAYLMQHAPDTRKWCIRLDLCVSVCVICLCKLLLISCVWEQPQMFTVLLCSVPWSTHMRMCMFPWLARARGCACRAGIDLLALTVCIYNR